MPKLTDIARIFYGISMAAMGFITIYYRDFPYMLIPPHHAWISDHVILLYLCGGLLFLAGICIVPGKELLSASRLLGAVLLLVFCFYFIPYELMTPSRYSHFSQWENAAKELALAAGALVIARYRWGIILFALTILSFGIDHYMYGKEAIGYMPLWVPAKLFWMYFCGTALLASGVAIMVNIQRRLAAVLLGTMIFIWVIILHIPKTLSAPFAENEGEITSAFLALAYCGIAFFISGQPTSGPVRTRPASAGRLS
ncbi:MAG TPA: hypothetical protein VL978_07175 [Puia sp.]|nr:hypothetical protein [Puia sp.]